MCRAASEDHLQAAQVPISLLFRLTSPRISTAPRPENVLHLPPLSEGEGLACRVLQLTPATFLAPVLLEVPHYTSVAEDRSALGYSSLGSPQPLALNHDPAFPGRL